MPCVRRSPLKRHGRPAWKESARYVWQTECEQWPALNGKWNGIGVKRSMLPFFLARKIGVSAKNHLEMTISDIFNLLEGLRKPRVSGYTPCQGPSRPGSPYRQPFRAEPPCRDPYRARAATAREGPCHVTTPWHGSKQNPRKAEIQNERTKVGSSRDLLAHAGHSRKPFWHYSLLY